MLIGKKSLYNKGFMKILLIGVLLVLNNISSAQVWTLKQCIDTARVYNKNLQIGKNTIAHGKKKRKEAIPSDNPILNTAPSAWG